MGISHTGARGMNPAPASRTGQGGGRRLWPLYAAGFTTAFGAHAVAANLGSFAQGHGESLLMLGLLLAVYDGAEGPAQTRFRHLG